MKSDRKILIAFLLNMLFSFIEFAGGIFTGSFAIISDSIHDFGDAISIGISWILEKISNKQPDKSHTYGYTRYSVLGSVITTAVLLFGSFVVIYNAFPRIIKPQPVYYDGMLILAIFGVVINFCAALFTKDKESLNQKAVNLHMLEDVLGWIVVLIGSVVMKLTDIAVIDPILSVAVAVFVFVNATKNLKSVIDIFLEKTPNNISIEKIKEHLMEIDGVLDVHHIHVRSIDGYTNYATLHIVTDEDAGIIKAKVKAELCEHGITHTTIETETGQEVCNEPCCKTKQSKTYGQGHHHHH